MLVFLGYGIVWSGRRGPASLRYNSDMRKETTYFSETMETTHLHKSHDHCENLKYHTL